MWLLFAVVWVVCGMATLGFYIGHTGDWAEQATDFRIGVIIGALLLWPVVLGSLIGEALRK